MSWTDIAFDCLKEERLETIVYVPDIVLAELIERVEADPYFTAISPTREEEGIGILCGAHLGGKRGVLMMQNSGIGNAANAIAGLITPCQIPFVMLINPRGDLGEFNPAQVGMGQALRPILDGLGIQHFTVEQEGALASVLIGATKLAFSTDRPVAVILSPLLTGGKTAP
ncbi:MAG: decarboxylase [Chloroflexota bacterium]